MKDIRICKQVHHRVDKNNPTFDLKRPKKSTNT